MKLHCLFYCTVFLFLLMSCTQKEIKIACIGDSITEGYGVTPESKAGYPALLDSIMGQGYAVLNCGRGGTTINRKGDFPYWSCNEFANVFSFQPDIIIIKLGTNDTRPHNWNEKNFGKDYQWLIDTLNTIPGKPQIYLCLPVPIFKMTWGHNDSILTKSLIPVIERIAKTNRLKVIDLYHPLEDQPEFFPDGVHPNEGAIKIIAKTISMGIR
jgi:acyl-CoA thioesterase I